VVSAIANDTLGDVAALDLQTGRVLWRFGWSPLPDDPLRYSKPAFRIAGDGDVVIAPASDARLFAIDVATGTQRWMVTRNGCENFARDINSATISQGIVVAVSCDALIAYDAVTGAERWRYRAAVGGEVNTGGAPLSDGTVVTVMNIAGWLTSWDLRTGQKVWQYRTPSREDGTGKLRDPVLFAGEFILAPAVDGVYAFRRR
jgi:outer membrane protein assembly factor BamB